MEKEARTSRGPGTGCVGRAISRCAASSPFASFALTTYFIADTHFGHGGALGLYRRPFASVAAMDAAMLQHWNDLVRPEDEVWHLGDFAIGRGGPARLEALAGTKRLVCGNNDGPATRALPGWASVHDYVELTLGGVPLVLCHYAFRSWNGMGRGAVNLHGHSHGRLSRQTRQVDVGVDVWAFRPVTLAQLLAPRAAGAVST